MTKEIIIQLLPMLLVSVMDGRISVDEIKNLFSMLVKITGIDMKLEFADIFTEQDGDLHIILKKSLLTKLSIGV